MFNFAKIGIFLGMPDIKKKEFEQVLMNPYPLVVHLLPLLIFLTSYTYKKEAVLAFFSFCFFSGRF